MSENLTVSRMLADPVKLVALTFMQDAVAATQSDVQLSVAEVTSGAANACDGYTMPWAGTIVGISYLTTAAASAGTLSIGPTVNGTEAADPTLAITTGTSGFDTATRGTATFAAGDRIGAEITTSGAWTAETMDLVVTVWCLVEVTGV
jgi:hypothetical protein